MLHTRLELPVPAEHAWRLLVDTQAWPLWGPSVRAVQAPSRYIARGMRGRVQTAPGLWLPFEITRWQSGREWAWSVGGVAATGHIVEPTGPTACRVTFTIPAWAPFYVPVCRLALHRLRRLALGA